MPVLRSREIVPKVKPKTPAETLDIGVFEPYTPAKTVEGLNQQSNVSPLSSSLLAPSQDTGGVGSETVRRRRSFRLASKINLELSEVGTVKISDDKGKNSDSLNERICSTRFGLGTEESESGQDAGNGFVHLGAKEARVADKMDMEIGVVEDMSQAVMGVKGMTVEPNVVHSCTDLGSMGSSDDVAESVKKGKRKRKSTVEDDLLGFAFAGQGENEHKFLNLRSGKRISKRELKEKNGENSKEVESNGTDKLSFGIESGIMSNGWIGSSGMNNEVEGNLEMAQNVNFESAKKLTRDEKGKGVVLPKTSSDVDMLTFELEAKSKGAGGNKMGGKPGRMDKGKEKLIENAISSKSIDVLETVAEKRVKKENGRALGSSTVVDSKSSQNSDRVSEITPSAIVENMSHRGRFREIAKQNASRFAHFSSLEEEDNHVADVPGIEIPSLEMEEDTEDWPGPFSTAMKIIKDRQMNANVQQQNSSSHKGETASVTWTPKKDLKCSLQKQSVPSLQDLCLSILAKNADAITSLDCVPDVIRHKLSHLLCDSRRMDCHFLDLLVSGSPTEIHLRDCSWLTEDVFTKTFERSNISNLMVLQLDQCGRCLPDYTLLATLAHSPNSLPALTSVSLTGAYRLSDVGLSALISSAPSLRSINLSQCSLLSFDGIQSLAASLGSVLRELYLDDCEGIDAMLILPALLKFKSLEVLSLAGIETVSDDFISKLVSAQGHGIKELGLANCMKLTDASVRVIAETCSKLCAIDLSNLCKLTDCAMAYLAIGSRSLQALKLCRNPFSDEAIAAYLETCGVSLKEFSLSNVNKVAENTAISLARHSRNLHSLDLSWCRSLTNEALGLIVDGCSSLKVLKVFGCTQITDVLLYGHSNPEVQIIGLNMKPILEHLSVPDFLQGPLRYSV